MTAAQLYAAGLPANAQVQSIGFNVTNTNSGGAHQNFQIRVYTTTVTNPISTGWFSGTPVAQTTPINHTPVPGWIQFIFASPFTCNG